MVRGLRALDFESLEAREIVVLLLSCFACSGVLASFRVVETYMFCIDNGICEENAYCSYRLIQLWSVFLASMTTYPV